MTLSSLSQKPPLHSEGAGPAISSPAAGTRIVFLLLGNLLIPYDGMSFKLLAIHLRLLYVTGGSGLVRVPEITMINKDTRLKIPAASKRHRSSRDSRGTVQVDLASLRAIDHACHGCAKDEKCCCATYEVCVTTREMNRIIGLLPEVAKFCPHFWSDEGYDNVFEEVEPGLFAIDTTEEGLCLFAYVSRGKIRCSLHTVGSNLGYLLDQVKPKACLLWPMTFSEREELLSLTGDAISFSCNSRKGRQSLSLCLSFVEAIELVYGEAAGALVKTEAGKGARDIVLHRRL
jgi:hypothetical protein